MTARVVDRTPHGAVVVSGPDAAGFLQSLVSQDIGGLADGQGARSLLLTPQGKLDVDFRILRVGDEWWLDCEAGYGSRLAAALERFKVRVAVDIADVSDRWGLVSVRGHGAAARVAAVAGVDVPDTNYAHVAWVDSRWSEARVVRSDWPGPGLDGADIVGPRDAVVAGLDALVRSGVVPFTPGAFEAARIEAGIPRLGADLDDSTIPQEAFLERDAISFAKGCFLGQEVVARIDARGHVNRFLRGVRMARAPAPPPGALVVHEGREVGTVTSAAVVPDEDRAVALAMVRREVEPPAAVTIRWAGAAGEAEGEVVELSPGSGR